MRRIWPLFAFLFSATLGAQDGAQFFLKPIADAFVANGPGGTLSGNNYGGAGAITYAPSSFAKGEMQSVLQFDLSVVANSCNQRFGMGGWSIGVIALNLTGAAANNPIFNPPAPGRVGISWMRNDSWTEGSGTPASPGTSGINFTMLQNLIGPNDETLIFDFPGIVSEGAISASLAHTPGTGLVQDILTGDKLTLRLFAADDQASNTFYSRSGSGPPELFIAVVPEPSQLALLGLGGLGLTGLRVWKRARRR